MPGITSFLNDRFFLNGSSAFVPTHSKDTVERLCEIHTVTAERGWLSDQIEQQRKLEAATRTGESWERKYAREELCTFMASLGTQLHALVAEQLVTKHGCLCPVNFVNGDATNPGAEVVDGAADADTPGIVRSVVECLARLKMTAVGVEVPVLVPDVTVDARTTEVSRFLLAVVDIVAHCADDDKDSLAIVEVKTVHSSRPDDIITRAYAAQVFMAGVMLQQQLRKQGSPLRVTRYYVIVLRPKLDRVSIYRVPFDASILQAWLGNEQVFNPEFVKLLNISKAHDNPI